MWQFLKQSISCLLLPSNPVWLGGWWVSSKARRHLPLHVFKNSFKFNGKAEQRKKNKHLSRSVTLRRISPPYLPLAKKVVMEKKQVGCFPLKGVSFWWVRTHVPPVLYGSLKYPFSFLPVKGRALALVQQLEKATCCPLPLASVATHSSLYPKPDPTQYWELEIIHCQYED